MAKASDKPKPAGTRKVSTTRCYPEQAELFKELSQLSGCNMQDAIEKHLDGILKKLIRDMHAKKAKG